MLLSLLVFAVFPLPRIERDGRVRPLGLLRLAGRLVTDLVRSSVRVVGLAFSRDGRWLVIGLDEGDSERLLTWRAVATGPLASSALLPGALFDTPTLAVR